MWLPFFSRCRDWLVAAPEWLTSGPADADQHCPTPGCHDGDLHMASLRGLFAPTSHSKKRPDPRVEDNYSGIEILGEPHFAVGPHRPIDYQRRLRLRLEALAVYDFGMRAAAPEAGAADLESARHVAAPPHAPG
jgi:hypothetical protein